MISRETLNKKYGLIEKGRPQTGHFNSLLHRILLYQKLNSSQRDSNSNF